MKCCVCKKELTDFEELHFGPMCPRCENESYQMWNEYVEENMEEVD